jgi:hypothetical protein
MVKSKLYTIGIILVVALLVVLPVAAGISGQGVSGVQIQNLSTTSATSVTVQLWNQDGSTPIDISGTGGDSIPPAAARNYYLPNLTDVPEGAYALIASAPNPIAGIARTDWAATGGAAIYSSMATGTDVTIPLVTRNFANQTSQFTIQNTNTGAAVSDVSITLYGRGSSTPVVTLTNQSIPAGTSKSWSLNDAVWGTLPDTGVDLGSPGFVGSIRITSATDLVVQSMIDLPGTPGVTAFSGVPTASASATLFCPLIRANYYGDTGISIVNPNASVVNATITFYSDAGSEVTGTFTQNLSIPANSSAVAFQGPGGNSRAAGLPGGSPANTTSNPTPTDKGFYGVATISTGGDNIMAVVNDSLFGAGWAVRSQSTYNCASAADAGTQFALPLVRSNHLAATRLTTGIQVQNTGATPVTVSMDLYNWDGTRQAASDPADIVIPANGSGNFWSGIWTGLPTVPASAGGFGWYGSAILRATGGNVVVVVSDEGYGTTAVDSANYNGLMMSAE